MTTLDGIFTSPKKPKKNFILENVNKVRQLEALNKTKEQASQNTFRKAIHIYSMPSRVDTTAKAAKPDLTDNSIGTKQPTGSYMGSKSESTVRQTKQTKSKTGRSQVKVLGRPNDFRSVRNLVHRGETDNIKTMVETHGTQIARHRSSSSSKSSGSATGSSLTESDQENKPCPVRSQCAQTINAEDWEIECEKGLVIYPSNLRNKREEIMQAVNMKENEKGDGLGTKQQANNKPGPQPLGYSIRQPPPDLPETYKKGVVPKYLRKRQQEIQEAEAQRCLADPLCPDGHLPLPDEDRKETLRLMKKNYMDLISELNKIPARSDTLRIRQRKASIEKQLARLDEGIKIFSRPKVYVKVGV